MSDMVSNQGMYSTTHATDHDANGQQRGGIPGCINLIKRVGRKTGRDDLSLVRPNSDQTQGK